MLLLVSSLMTPAFPSPPARAWGGGRFDEFPFQTHHEAFGMISKVLRPNNSPGLGTKHKSTFLGRQWEGGGFGYHNQILLFFLASHFFSSSYKMGILLVSLLQRYPRTLLTSKPRVLFSTFFLPSLAR